MFKPKQGFRVELHTLKSHAASRLNRDGADRPKTIYIGGGRRLRISSQGERYSIKISEIFDHFLDEANRKYGATRLIRTRHAADSIKELLQAKILAYDNDPAAYEEQINISLTSLQKVFSGKKNERPVKNNITQLISFSVTEIEHIADILFALDRNGEIAIKDSAKTIQKINKERNSIGPLSPEIQLFGRFTIASNYLKNVDSPLQISHGFTVHEAQIEQDYWTAVDDLNKLSGRQGSAHIDMRPFGAGVFYHYYCLDVPLLSRNISEAFSNIDQSQRVELTRDLIAAFLYSAICRNPVGGQTGHANHDMPSCVYITYGNAFPYCAQDAFERPVLRDLNGGYVEGAKQRFLEWLDQRKKRYGIFCGFEQSMGLGEPDIDLQTMIETTVEEATAVIRSEIFAL